MVIQDPQGNASLAVPMHNGKDVLTTAVIVIFLGEGYETVVGQMYSSQLALAEYTFCNLFCNFSAWKSTFPELETREILEIAFWNFVRCHIAHYRQFRHHSFYHTVDFQSITTTSVSVDPGNISRPIWKAVQKKAKTGKYAVYARTAPAGDQ